MPFRLSPGTVLALALSALPALPAAAQTPLPTTPPEQRGRIDAERAGTHDANRIRTIFYNYGMVGDFQGSPDLSVFHSVEVPRGSGVNYSDGITPFVLARVAQRTGAQADVMLTGFRERQIHEPDHEPHHALRAAPRLCAAQPGHQRRPLDRPSRTTRARGPAPPTPRACSTRADASTAGPTSERPRRPGLVRLVERLLRQAPQRRPGVVLGDGRQYYDAFDFYPDSRDDTRRGLGLRVEVRGFQWSNPQAQDVIFWHYDIVNESTTTYDDIIFGIYMDSGVGGSGVSCDGVAESDDDNASFNERPRPQPRLHLGQARARRVAREQLRAHRLPRLRLPRDARQPLQRGIDDDSDGITDEMRDCGPGQRLEGQDAIRAWTSRAATTWPGSRPPTARSSSARPTVAGVWLTGDEDMDWVAAFSDYGSDGVSRHRFDAGEDDGRPTSGEPNFDKTDITESDQIGLTGFKMNRIRAGAGAPDGDRRHRVLQQRPELAQRLYDQFPTRCRASRFDQPLGAQLQHRLPLRLGAVPPRGRAPRALLARARLRRRT